MRLTQTGIVLSEHSSQSQSRGNYYCHNRHQLDEDVQRRAASVLEWVADGVTDDCRIVRGITLRCTFDVTLLNGFLGIVPSTTSVGHE